MNLKDRKLQEAKTKLKVLEEKLKFLEFSNLQDKEEKVSYFMALFFYF